MKLNGNNGEHRHVASGKKDIQPKPENKGGKRALRRALVTLGVLVVVVLGVVIGYSVWETPPDFVGPGSTSSSGQTNLSDPAGSSSAVPDSSSPTDSELGPSAPPVEEPVDDHEGALMTDRDDGIYTFLLVGRDHGSNSTDTIIVGKFDTNKHTIDMVNIPRDTLINISWGGTPKKINAVYPGYTNSYNLGLTETTGIEALRTQVKNILGFDVDFYAVVNLKVVEDVIDEIGGVYFDVPVDMHYDDYDQSFHVHLDKGYQHLNGYEALGVFRFRYGGYHNGVKTEGYPGGDVQRIETQQALLKATAKQLLNLGNIPNLGNIIDLCLENVETTLDASNMAFFARQFLKCSMADINFHEMPWSGFSMINHTSFVNIDVEPWIELVNERLNPYNEPVTISNVNILTANYEGTYLSATTGVIAGGWESFFCRICGYGHLPAGCPTGDEESDTPPKGESGEGDTSDTGADSGGETTGDTADPTPQETPAAQPPADEGSSSDSGTTE